MRRIDSAEPAAERDRPRPASLPDQPPARATTGTIPARAAAQARATRRSPARSAARSSRQRQTMPRNGPISIRPSSVLFTASTARDRPPQPRPDRRVEVVRSPGRRAGRSAAGRSDARGAGRGTARTAAAARAPGTPAPRSAAGSGVGWPWIDLVLQRRVLRQDQREQRHRDPEARGRRAKAVTPAQPHR